MSKRHRADFDIDGVLQEEERQRVQREIEQSKADYIAVMSTEQGRRFVYRLILDSGILSPIVPQPNASLAQFEQGRKETGQRLFVAGREWCQEQIFLMLQENSSERTDDTESGDERSKPESLADEFAGFGAE